MSRTDLNRYRPRWAAAVLVSTVLAVAVGACAGNDDASGRRSATTTARTTSFVTAGERLGVGGCPLFPRDHAFHASVAALPVRRDSAEVVAALGGRSLAVRPAFSASIWQGSRSGIPVNVVDSRLTAPVDVDGGTYAYLSDLSGHPIPASPRLEGWPGMAWDRHLLIVDSATCTASEMFFVTPPGLSPTRRWSAETAVRIDLGSNSPRAEGTATASGTSMLAGMVRYDEVARDRLDHAVGVSVPTIRAGAVRWPATHTDGRSEHPRAPEMGSWLRLRRDVDLSALGPQARVVARALRDHGAVVVDTNHDGLALLGEPDERWDDADLATLRTLTAADFEVVDPDPMRAEPGTESYRIR